jgi:NAD(P) transhydrogenase subunit beta
VTLTQAITLAYLLAAVLFILGLKGLSTPRRARPGNLLAAVGMIIALAATLILIHPSGTSVLIIVAGVVIGTPLGAISARSVRMTAMPQMVAAFNGVGGGAAALVSVLEYNRAVGQGDLSVALTLPAVLSVIIGAISFAGSLIAFAKLQELMSGTPITYRGQQVVNGVIATLVALLAVALILGIAFPLPIGGADMPVVISLLNACTGLAVAASGFVLNNSALIVAGTLVGASGTLLTKMMSDAMGRSLANVMFGAFGAAPQGGPAGTGGAADRPVRPGTPDDVGTMLAYSRRVVITPGYGLAVAQAQHAAHDLAMALEKRGVEVEFAIHPVAGRMPGHMNVLLAEANVPYEQLKEMDEINGEFPQVDVVLVVGANDVVNPAARNTPNSPIYGMPILNVDEAKNIVFLKRSMRPGFAGIDNDLMYDPKTIMLFGDAKDSLTKLVAAVRAA